MGRLIRTQRICLSKWAGFWFKALTCTLFLFQSAGLDLLDAADNAVLRPADSISQEHQNHIHGIGYDGQKRRLFIATHHGIFIWQNNRLFQLGDNRDDFMGFSLHPTDANVVYTSGHPARGGNLGVLKSEDGGVSFKRIFGGLSGETVDFHSMTISAANPNVLYGFFQGKLYFSKNGGKDWRHAPARGLGGAGFCFGAPCLAADSKSESTVYAGTPAGLLVSSDFGESWRPIQATLGPFAGVGVDPANSHRLVAFTEKLGLALSKDRGKTWQPKNNGLRLSSREFIFAFAFDATNPKHLFAATPESVFRSEDGGESWKKIL
ncbi:MAG TPA: hypothetical protein VNL14_21490 [Candidatus Acidoferrales bacterium]|nr:hypothetical protein [Candidatus Acidoferrales bacterium]